MQLNTSREAAAPHVIDGAVARLPVRGRRHHPPPRFPLVALKAWGTRLTQRTGAKQATAAAAREVAIILHRVLHDGGESRCPAKEAQAA
jgi:hypothetical protein